MMVNKAIKSHAYFNNLFLFRISRSAIHCCLCRNKHWQAVHETP